MEFTLGLGRVWYGDCFLVVSPTASHLPGVTMSNAPRFNNKTPVEMPKEMTELVQLIANLPAEHRCVVEPALVRVMESAKRRRRILNLVQDALSQLRLDMKYLVFDLEATRRERDSYRETLDEGTNRED